MREISFKKNFFDFLPIFQSHQLSITDRQNRPLEWIFSAFILWDRFSFNISLYLIIFLSLF